MVTCPICLTVPSPIAGAGRAMQCGCQRLFLIAGAEANFHYGHQMGLRYSSPAEMLFFWSGRWSQVRFGLEEAVREAVVFALAESVLGA